MKLFASALLMLSIFNTITSWETFYRGGGYTNGMGKGKMGHKHKGHHNGFFQIGGYKHFPGRYHSYEPKCPIMAEPCCSRDGVSYQNKCQLKKAGGIYGYDGYCSQKSSYPKGPQRKDAPQFAKTPMNGYLAPGYPWSGCPCNMVKNEICGANGITYGNACRASC